MSDKVDTPTAAGTGRNSAELLGLLRSRILSGRVAPGEFLPTVRRLSEEHGVSRGTAWRALKALVAEGLVAAQPRHGYRVLARAADPDRGAPLAYVLSGENIVGGWDVYYRQLSEALERAARRRGWSLMRMITERGGEEDLFEQLSGARVCGLILDSVNTELLERARASGLPVVMVEVWRPGADFDAVVQDDFAGGQLAAEDLLAAGCRRIAWLGSVTGDHHARARYGGAAAALAAEGLSFSHVLDRDLGAPDLATRAREVLGASDRPDGVLALWRPMAAATITAARELGLSIGRDFRMVGWSSEAVYEQGFVPLFEGGPVPPTVVWSTRVMAETALARLAERRARPEVPAIRMTVPARLEIREEAKR